MTEVPAHPNFTAHFTSSIYDPDSTGNDDVAPFGTDDAADTFAEWAERTDELPGLTLRQMLELEDEPMGSKSGPADFDEEVIAAGFIHLRVTGWIDREGAEWLSAALRRGDRENPGTEYSTMLRDLATYSNKAPKVPTASTQRGWFRLHSGPGDSQLTQWSRSTEDALVANEAWRSWWSSTPYDALEFYPHLNNPTEQVTIREEGSRLVVSASTPDLTRATRKHLGIEVTGDSLQIPSLTTVPGVLEMLERLLLFALRTAADRQALQTPPPRLPNSQL